MYRTIMVPLDGSPFAEEALPLALGLAGRFASTLHLVHVAEPLDQVAPEMAALGREYPKTLAEPIRESTGIEIVAARRGGDVIESLSGYIADEAVDLVVIATHGWGGLKRVWLGSVADALIREAHTPILAVRPPFEGRVGEGPEMTEIRAPVTRRSVFTPVEPPHHILVPLDGSELAESILTHAVQVGGDDARVTLLQVVPAPLPNDPVSVSLALSTGPQTFDEDRSRALAYLEGVADRLVQNVARVDTAVVLEPDIVTSILDHADQNEVDLIAIATHGRGGIKRLALGSVADEILRKSEPPVLVFRPEEP